MASVDKFNGILSGTLSVVALNFLASRAARRASHKTSLQSISVSGLCISLPPLHNNASGSSHTLTTFIFLLLFDIVSIVVSCF